MERKERREEEGRKKGRGERKEEDTCSGNPERTETKRPDRHWRRFVGGEPSSKLGRAVIGLPVCLLVNAWSGGRTLPGLPPCS